MPYFTSNTPSVALKLSVADAEYGSHAGNCDQEIADLRAMPKIKRQLDKIPADNLRAELGDYGAWDDTELADHDENLSRILWIACGDIREEARSPRS